MNNIEYPVKEERETKVLTRLKRKGKAADKEMLGS